MTEKPRSGPDAGVVTAACAGDRQALDHLLTQCLPLVYNIVGRALNGHADVDDVVQETLLRMVRGLPKLRDPAAFRSWLVAITIRQVRDREQTRAADRDRRAHLEDAEAITDPALDFAGLTILRLGLTEQRREVVEATRWLDPDDQELLSLWWLEETGELERAELAGALGLSDRHASVRVQRMKKQMEVSRVVVRALAAAPRCTELEETASTWDGTPSALWRKRFARHIRGCGVCQGLDAGLLPMDRLLSGLPLVAVPTGLDPARVLNAVMGEGGSSSPADQPVHSAHRGSRRRHGRRSGRSGRMGKQVVGGSAAVAVVVVAALVAPRLTGVPLLRRLWHRPLRWSASPRAPRPRPLRARRRVRPRRRRPSPVRLPRSTPPPPPRTSPPVPRRGSGCGRSAG